MNKHSEFKDYLEFPENPAKKKGEGEAYVPISYFVISLKYDQVEQHEST